MLISKRRSSLAFVLSVLFWLSVESWTGSSPVLLLRMLRTAGAAPPPGFTPQNELISVAFAGVKLLICPPQGVWGAIRNNFSAWVRLMWPTDAVNYLFLQNLLSFLWPSFVFYPLRSETFISALCRFCLSFISHSITSSSLVSLADFSGIPLIRALLDEINMRWRKRDKYL